MSLAIIENDIEVTRNWVELAEFVREAFDPRQVFQVAEQAKRLAAAIREANDLRRNAVRMECVALRRLGQLKQIHDEIVEWRALDSERRNLSSWFANMEDDEFSEVVNKVDKHTSVCAFGRDLTRQGRDAAERKDLERLLAGKGPKHGALSRGGGSFGGSGEVKSAASTIVKHLVQENEGAFTTSQAIVALGDALDLDYSDPIIKEGLRKAVRTAIQNAETPDGCPVTVTGADGLNRPWASATLDHLVEMTRARFKLAQDTLEAAHQLQSLVHLCEMAQEEHPGVVLVSKLHKLAFGLA